MFKKYPSLTNHYHNKDIGWLRTKFENAMNGTKWVIQEKIHGANVSFLFQPNAPPKIFSRNQEITGSDFYSADEIINETIDHLQPIQYWLDKTSEVNTSIRLFGELFGDGIQKGVDYGRQKQIRFFDLMQNNLFKSTKDLKSFFGYNNLTDLLVPEVGIVDSFEEAMEFDTNFNSLLSDKPDNLIEGIVIKPYEIVLIDGNGSLFYVKKKNEEFKEKQKVKKKIAETVYSDEVNKLKENLLSHINDNRVQSVFSKEGGISSQKDIGKYIQMIQQDALEDFKKENIISDNLTKQERKYIMNVGKEIKELLNKYL